MEGGSRIRFPTKMLKIFDILGFYRRNMYETELKESILPLFNLSSSGLRVRTGKTSKNCLFKPPILLSLFPILTRGRGGKNFTNFHYNFVH